MRMADGSIARILYDLPTLRVRSGEAGRTSATRGSRGAAR
jgi:hypothetical protein